MGKNFTFLTEEQATGGNQLAIFNEYDLTCAVTDYAILLGAGVSNSSHTKGSTDLSERTGNWWLKTADGDDSVFAVDYDGDLSSSDVDIRYVGARPAIAYSAIKDSAKNTKTVKSGIKEVEYGEYPQTIVSGRLSQVLEDQHSSGYLRRTGKNYTIDSNFYDDFHLSFDPMKLDEFEYQGEKYVRVVGDYNSTGAVISNGQKVCENDPYWIKVEPIKWIVDEKSNIAISKKILFSGVQFDFDVYDGDFSKSDIKMYMDKYFSEEIMPNRNVNNNLLDIDNMDMTLLEYNQVFTNNRLKMFDEYDRYTGCTNFSMILGCKRDIDEDGYYWLAKRHGGPNAYMVDTFGVEGSGFVGRNDIGIRPVVPYSAIKSMATLNRRVMNGVCEVECGEYPQQVASDVITRKLERLFLNGDLTTTDKTYTFFRKENNNFNTDKYIPTVCSEYVHDGKKYIRIKHIGDPVEFDDDPGLPFPNKRIINTGDYVWVEVSPVTWIVNERDNVAVSEQILLSGIRYDDHNNYDGDFSKTELKGYLNNYMKFNIFSSYTPVHNNISTHDDEYVEVDDVPKARKENPYNFNFESVSEEDIIRGAVESNVSVFLHGRSSEGKSARVKELDPDCVILYMRNATPDSLNGKSVYNANTDEMKDVPPTWYTKIKEKCDAEPDKIHIVFFDELTNALPSIQGMAFNIVLDGEVNGKWKLPSNARIVAAGNDLNDSLAANQMAEPLFNRFAHVYIETDVDSWLKWASTPAEDYQRIDYTGEDSFPKIHPAIYAFVAYRSYNGDDVLRTEYTGDKPNADPRKWEMASKVLYKTNKPEMLRALVGEEITYDFVEFTKQQVITIDDVLNNNYNDADLEMNTAQKFATAVGLSSVDEEHVEVVREFMKKLGAEPRAAFESMWTHGDKKRLEILAELQLKDEDTYGGLSI